MGRADRAQDGPSVAREGLLAQAPSSSRLCPGAAALLAHSLWLPVGSLGQVRWLGVEKRLYENRRCSTECVTPSLCGVSLVLCSVQPLSQMERASAGRWGEDQGLG